MRRIHGRRLGEERGVRMRLMALQQNKVKALRHATELLRERPTDASMFRAAIGVHLWNNACSKIDSLANALLALQRAIEASEKRADEDRDDE